MKTCPVPPNLIIRADASPEIGTGHVMRCLALAQAWLDAGGRVSMAMAACPDGLRQRLVAERVGIVAVMAPVGSAADAAFTADWARQEQALLVVDGYRFGGEYQELLKTAGVRLLFVDDNGHASHYSADWVLNQNIHAAAALYPQRASHTRLLLGTRYALLRREFYQWSGWERSVPARAHRILVTLGGSDPGNATETILMALLKLPVRAEDEMVVVAGGANPHWDRLQTVARRGGGRVRLVRATDDMPGLMKWVDLAVTAGGSTCWEAAFFGLPSAVVVVAENQLLSTQRLQETGVVLSLGPASQLRVDDLARDLERLVVDAPLRARLSARGRALVDGAGAARVVAVLRGNEPE